MLLLADHDDRPKLLGFNDSISKSTDSGLPQPNYLGIPTPSHLAPKVLVPFKETSTHPNAQSVRSFAVDRSFIIGYLISPFAFSLYILPLILAGRGIGISRTSISLNVNRLYHFDKVFFQISSGSSLFI